MSQGVRLLIRRGDAEVASAVPGERPIAIGRSKRCDIVLDDPAISRFHAVLAIEDEGLSLTDQDSQNGLWVHGRRVKKVWLKPDLPVVMGPFRVTLESVTAEPFAAASRQGTEAPGQPPAANTGSPEQKSAGTSHPSKSAQGGTSRRSLSIGVAVAVALLLVVAVTGSLLFYRWRTGGGMPTNEAAASSSGATPVPTAAAVPTPSTEAEPAAPASAPQGDPTTEAAAQPTVAPGVAAESQGPDADDTRVIPAGRRPGESTAAWRRRSRQLTTRYLEAKAALERGDSNALQLLAALERAEPGFGDTAALIADARTKVRGRARAALDEGTRLEAQNNLTDAWTSYERALKLDPEYSEARSAETAIRQKMKASADETFRKASVEDAFGRADRAVTLYKRVVELLPDGDPTREKAEARLTALQVNKP
jgi:hypothetical protein